MVVNSIYPYYNQNQGYGNYYSNSNNAAQNQSLFGSNFNNNNSSGLTLGQLEQRRAAILSQVQNAAHSSPELAEKYKEELSKTDEAISNKLNNGVSSAEKYSAVTNIDNQISRCQTKLNQLSMKRKVLSFQASQAVENNPELSSQYQIMDKDIQAQQVELTDQIKSLKEQKAKISDSDSSQTNQTQSGSIQQMLMMLLQYLMRG